MGSGDAARVKKNDIRSYVSGEQRSRKELEKSTRTSGVVRSVCARARISEEKGSRMIKD